MTFFLSFFYFYQLVFEGVLLLDRPDAYKHLGTSYLTLGTVQRHIAILCIVQMVAARAQAWIRRYIIKDTT